VNTFDELILLIVEYATKPAEVANVSSETLMAGARTFGLGGGGTQAAKITERAFNYTVTGDTFDYDVSNIKSNLPADIGYLSTTVSVKGSGKTPASSRASMGSISLPSGADQVQVKLTLQTTDGQLNMTKTFPISKNSNGTVALQMEDNTSSPSDMSVKQNIELLNRAVAELSTKK
jgi:hypothetical protein